jgi:transposase-like protein
MDYAMKNAFHVINSALHMITVRDQYTSAQLYIIRIISHTFRLVNEAIIRLHMKIKKDKMNCNICKLRSQVVIYNKIVE